MLNKFYLLDRSGMKSAWFTNILGFYVYVYVQINVSIKKAYRDRSRRQGTRMQESVLLIE